MMVAAKMYLGAVIELESGFPVLLTQVLEFTVTARQTVSAVEIVDTQRLVTQPVGGFDKIAWMRCAVQKTEIGFTQPLVEIIERPRHAD